MKMYEVQFAIKGTTKRISKKWVETENPEFAKDKIRSEYPVNFFTKVREVSQEEIDQDIQEFNDILSDLVSVNLEMADRMRDRGLIGKLRKV